MKYLYIVLIIILIISCNKNSDDETIIKNCSSALDCSYSEDCKFDSIDEIIGICVEKIECEYSYQCDNNRDCVSRNDIKTCGREGDFDIFTQELSPMYLYENYNDKIEVKNNQGEYYLKIIDGSLPKGITISSIGEITGFPEDEVGVYSFTIEAINAPIDSNIFFNYIKAVKTFQLELKDSDLCNYTCNKYQTCNIINKECENIPIPDNMVRVYMANDEIYQGILIGKWNHNNWLWDNSNEYSYAIFEERGYDELSDRSIKILSSKDIISIEMSADYLDISQYDDFLVENNISLEIPLKDEVLIVEGNEGYHLKEDGYGDFAYDFVELDDLGYSYTNDGSQNSDYYIWNQDVYLPIDGKVFELYYNNNDNEYPGEYVDESQANMIGIKIKGNYYLYMLHLKKNSIPMLINNNCTEDISDLSGLPECIEIGKNLKAGSYVGKVGNSGVSLVPHLHLTMFWYDVNSLDNTRMWSIPSLFKNIHKVGSSLGEEIVDYDFYRPKTGDILKNIK